MDIDIIYEDEHLIAINKPHGLLVHRSKIANDANVFALQLLRDKINQHVYPVHRIDRKTSGVLLFTKKKEILPNMQQLFRNRNVRKTYKSIVRGFVENNGVINYPLLDGNKMKEASTSFKLLKTFELPLPLGKFKTGRYSLVELRPYEGRHHQIRKHMAHIFHPILGDRPHGCNKQNKLWKEKYDMTTMMLHAEQLVLSLDNDSSIKIEAPWSQEFNRVIDIMTINQCNH